ncbi:MAG: hypothetical protein ABW000_03040 [Actinoplanes sp.]
MKLKLSTTIVALTATVALGTVLTGAAGAYAGTSSVSHSSTAVPAVVDASGPGLFPHSADYDPRSRTFVVGSLAHSTISAVSLDGRVRTLVDDKALVAVQAVRVDAKRNRILATEVDYGLAERSTPATTFRLAGLASYHTGNGHRQWYADLDKTANDGEQHLVSDVTIAPDGTAYAVDELTPTIFRVDRHGRASVLLRDDLLAGVLDIPGFLNDVGMSAVAWMPGNVLIVAMADGSLVRVPVDHPEQTAKVQLSTGLKTITAGIQVLPDGSIAALSSGLLTGQPAVVQRVRPTPRWTSATVTVTDTVTDPVTSAVVAGPCHTTYALSGGLAALLAGQPNDGFTLRQVNVG